MHHLSMDRQKKQFQPSHKNVISNPESALNLVSNESTLTIKVNEAKLLVNVSKIGEMNTFVKVIYGNQEWTTSVTNNHMNPKWKESKTFTINYDIKKTKSQSQILDLGKKKQFCFNPDYITIIVFHKGVFNIFTNDEIGRKKIEFSEMVQCGSKPDWHCLTKKNDIVGSILLSFEFEGLSDNKIPLKPRFSNQVQDKKLSNPPSFQKINPFQAYNYPEFRNQTEFQEISNKKSIQKTKSKISESKQPCKTETSPITYIDNNIPLEPENNSFSDFEEIQKKYDNMDEKTPEQNSEKSFWENLDDCGESEEEPSLENDDWNDLLYENESMRLRDVNELLEDLKLENNDIKEREKMVKEQFEILKNEYTKVAKEKKGLESRKNQIQKREICLKNEKKFLNSEIESFKSEQLALLREIDCYKEVEKELQMLKKEEKKLIKSNLEMEENILCLSRSNMFLPQALFIAQKNCLSNLLSSRIALYELQNEKHSINNQQEGKIENPNDDNYKTSLYDRIGIEGEFDLSLYLSQLERQIIGLKYQIDNKIKDIQYMEQRMLI